MFEVEDSPLAERAAQFAQGDLFLDGLGDKSGIALFEDGLEAALSGNMDSELFDDGLLASFLAFGESFRWGVERVEVVNGRTVAVNRDGLARIEALTRRTARPQHVRVAGKLEVLRHTKHRFLLQLSDGSTVVGLAEQMADEELARHFGRMVVVEGTAHFHPSGKAQRIEATRLAPATELDLKLFATQPKALSDSSASGFRLKPSTDGERWIDAIWGKWPGDETEKEVVELIKEFS